MNSISFGGLASGLDTNAIVNGLVGLERRAVQRSEQRRGEAQRAISDFSTLRARLDALRGVVRDMADPATFGRVKATSAEPGLLSAAADGDATAGSWRVEVAQLASASRFTSDPQADRGAALPEGALEITIGGATTRIDVQGGMSLDGLKDAINGAGIAATASVVRDNAGFRLVVAGTRTGADNALVLQEVDGLSAGLSDPANALSQARNARVVLDGRLTIEGDTNTLTGAIDGLTLSLHAASPGQTFDLDLSRDAEAQADAVERLVGAYNEAVGFIQSRVKPAQIGQRALLHNDVAMTGVRDALRGALQAIVPNGSDFNSAARLGLTSTANGQIKLDRAALARALEADSDGTISVFTQDGDGLADRLKAAIDGALEAGGPLDNRKNGLDRRVRDLNRQVDAQSRRVDAFEARLRAQFQSMEQLVSRLNDQSSMLQSRLGIS